MESEKIVNAPKSFLEDHYKTQKSRFQNRLLETRITFYVTLILLIIGIIIAFGGFVLIIVRNPLGVTATLGGSISAIINGVIFVFNNETNKRLDEAGWELASLAAYIDGINHAEHVINQITDQGRKDKALEDLAKNSQKGPQQENHRSGLTSFGIRKAQAK